MRRQGWLRGFCWREVLDRAWKNQHLLPAPAGVCREDTLTQLFLSSIRKGKESEACLAAKALGLHVTTLGASTASEGIYQEVCGHQRPGPAYPNT